MMTRKLAPIPLMLAGMLVSFVLLIIAVHMATRTPWLGLDLAFDDNRQLPVIEQIHNQDVTKILREGDLLQSISDPYTDKTVDLSGFMLRVEPPSYPTFAGHNALLVREDSIAALLDQPEVLITTGEGKTALVRVLPKRPMATLGYEFWLFNLFGLIAWNISLVVWVIRPRAAAARLLFASGAGFFMATFFNSIYKARELALPQDIFFAYSRANQLGLYIMLFSLLALMAYYPRRITRISPALYILPALFFYHANETYQWIEWPLHTFYVPVFALYLAGVVVASYQWRISAQHPLDRAALKWILLSIFIIMGLGLAMYFIPLALMERAVFPQIAMVGTASLLYIGFAFGIVRYRLFDVERWWLEVWAWFLGGLSVVIFDLALVTLLKMQPTIALGIALIAVGWIYFPLRQLVWRKLQPASPDSEFRLADQIERIAQAMPAQHTDPFWIRLLEEAYQPANIFISNHPSDSVELLNNGSAVLVPLLCTDGTVRLTFPNKGRRLFSVRDRKHLESLLTIAKRILTVHEAEMAAVQRERERIVRDLHDDVGGYLMTVLRRAPSEDLESPARKALKGLRESMRVLDGNPLQDLRMVLEDMKAEVEEKLEGTDVRLLWQQSLEDDSLEITMRQAININHILSEAVNNALEHADSKIMRVDFSSDQETITLKVTNDGAKGLDPNQKLLRGRGLNNMHVRASELGGQLTFAIDGPEAKVVAVLPIHSD